MSAGKWLLTFDAWDTMESWGNEHYVAREELVATTEEAALIEARALYEQLVASPRYHHKVYAAGEFPRNPRVVYEVNL